MNQEIANAMFGYLETLYNCNQNIIKLCGLDIMYNSYDYKKIILDVIQDIPRLIPYSYINKHGKLELVDRDGLIEFNDELGDIKSKYNEILTKNYIFLDKVRKIRNQYEHKMHNVKEKSEGSGTVVLFEFSFEVNNETIDIFASEVIELFKMLNKLYSNIVEMIKTYACENGKTEFAYYSRICRFDFGDFNLLYDSNLINKIGKCMSKF